MTRRKTLPGKQKKAPATAPGQTLGYSLQFTRLTAMLLGAADGSTCSLEVLDDIDEQSADGMTKLSQSKSALTDNPVADRAISLWKTFFNWLELVKGGYVVPNNTIFELYVSREVRGELVQEFSEARTEAAASLALSKARTILWGEAPSFDKKAGLPENLGRYANSVLDAGDSIIPVIINFRLECGSGSPQADIESLIRRGPVSEARVFDIADKLCGWVKRNVDKQLERGLPAAISRDDFHHEFVSYVRRVDQSSILTSLASKPSDAEKLERLPDTFVQQLGLIGLGFDDKLEAISDFLRACWDRTIWSKTGDVHEASFDELDDKLNRTWRNHRDSTDLEASSKSKMERGLLLHSRCMLYEAKVQGMEPPSHFVPGCFHRLADNLVIGWHPEYRNLLDNKETSDR